MKKIMHCPKCHNRIIKIKDKFICRKCNFIYFDKAVMDSKIKANKLKSDNKVLNNS